MKAGDQVVASARAVRLLPLCRRRSAAALRDRHDAGRWRATSTPGEAPSGGNQALLPGEPVEPDAGGLSTFARSPTLRMRRAQSSSSTMCSRRRCCRSRSNSAPTSSSIRRPSTSTARAGARRRDSRPQADHRRELSTISSATPARRCRPFNAWLLLKGLETLELRVERQCRTRGEDRRFPRRARRVDARDLSRPATTIRSTTLARAQMSAAARW